MDETQKGLLRAVLEKPWDDAPRLVYADWLDDHDQSDWAEFIRIQCELAAWASNDSNAGGHMRLASGERRFLLYENCKGWIPDQFTVGNGNVGPWGTNTRDATLHRGFVASVSLPLVVLVGGECGRCESAGLLCPEEYESHPGHFDPAGRYPENDPADPDCADCGGTRSEHTACPDCSGTGRTPGIIGDLFARHPVTEVKLTDIYIYQSGGNDTFYRNLGVFPSKYWRQLEFLPSRHAVEKSSSRVCVSYGRELVGLPPLPDDIVTMPQPDARRETEARRSG
jgi:uncharacterized protein (TIGR02996 family)